MILIAVSRSPGLQAQEKNLFDLTDPLVKTDSRAELMDLVQEVDRVGITVKDMDRAIAFYFVSEALVNISEPKLGFKRGFMVRDPDGHVLRIVEK